MTMMIKTRTYFATMLGSLLLSFSPTIIMAQGLMVMQPVQDCGKTAYRSPVTATFEVVNKSAKKIVLSDVKADCGCVATEITKKEIAKGESSQVKLTYDARMLGHFEKTALVRYYIRGSAKVMEDPVLLTMKGVVLEELKDYSDTYPYSMGSNLLADKDVLEFDDVRKGDHPEIVINVLNNGVKPMNPNILHLPQYLTAFALPETLQPGKCGKVIVTLSSQHLKDYGLTQSSVYLASNLGDKVSPDIELPVSIVLLPDLKTFEGKTKQYAPKLDLSSKSIELGKVNSKMVKKTTLLLTNKGRLPLEISSMQMFTGGLTVTLGKRTLQPGETTKLKVKGDLERLKKSRTKPRLLMITNDPDQTKLIIPVVVNK